MAHTMMLLLGAGASKAAGIPRLKAKKVLKSRSNLTLDEIIGRLKMVRIDDGSKK